ncbi:hypothetical protein PG999_003971 [Apiospora kogelbergensis]|uniref:ATPase family associated with various cellular activities (AAA) n=1 Tax=Apiospora kogelbergensis TaxID=1337665 RepID=A0AAW0R4Y9_9PEZI
MFWSRSVTVGILHLIEGVNGRHKYAREEVSYVGDVKTNHSRKWEGAKPGSILIEGVAELFQKPLFHITCGDLGTTAREVEQELEKNFALASRWGCILLLDEADVFLSSRERKDFARNGLVAVFLRVLEYYTGILFLTTNRIGDFDEAFASRIHMSLYYPELDVVKTRKVFKLNLDIIKERFDRQGRQIIFDYSAVDDFAQTHFRDYAFSRWNGRQIRNACQTALALAEYDAHGGQIAQDDESDDKNVVVMLRLDHFRRVQKAYLDFGIYLGDIRGTQGDRRAFDYGLRAKSHTPYQANHTSQSSATMNTPGLNVNHYPAAGYSSPYNAQNYPPQGNHMVNLPHHQVSHDDLRGNGGAYTTGGPSAAGEIPHVGSSFSDSQPTQTEPRFYQGLSQQGGGQAWSNPGPGANQGYPPATMSQQGQTMAPAPQWQNSFHGQQQYQGPSTYGYNTGSQIGGAQGPPTSGADSTVQSQAPHGGQSGGPAVATGGGPNA